MKYTHVCMLLVILISFIPESLTLTQTFKAQLLTSGNFHIVGAVGSSIVRGLASCTDQCFQNKKCMTFFYNNDTKQCILHSKTFKYSQPMQTGTGWKMYLLTEIPRRCPSDNGFLHYRELDICYNFNGVHHVDYPGHIYPTCASYGGELLRIDSQERQTYIEHVTEGKPTVRLAIQGHSYNPGYVWTFDDGTPLPYLHWNSYSPRIGEYYLQLFLSDLWTDQIALNLDKDTIFLCEIR